MNLETIAAISTAYGTAGISVIRVTGPESINKINEIFKGPNLNKAKTHTLHYGFITSKENQTIDEVMVAVLKGPRSFTTEDMIEISTHGGILVTEKVLKRILETGIRLARPGEFTERAFIHGRIDLAESEAVMDLISARSEKAMDLALSALKGSTTKLIKDLRDELLNIIAAIEVNIDYPEYDDVEEFTHDKIKPEINDFIIKVDNIITESNKGRMIREGVDTVIVGKPNVGKSSILNALLNEDRAIVTNIEGTTRDTIEVSINVGGIILNLIDTAGIRETDDIIEQIGVQKSREAIDKAELIILVVDTSKELTEEDKDLLELTKEQKRIIVGNKKDLGAKIETEGMVLLSALKKEGIETLEQAIIDKLELRDFDVNFNYLSNIRHIQKMEETKQLLYNAIIAIEEGYPIDMVELDIKEAWKTLGEITGDYHPEDLIDELFSRFCLGK